MGGERFGDCDFNDLAIRQNGRREIEIVSETERKIIYDDFGA